MRFLVFLSRPLFSPSVPRFFSFWAAVCCIHSSSSLKLFVESRRAYLVNVFIGAQRRMRAVYEFRLSMYGSCSRSYSRTGLLTHQGMTRKRQYVPENVAPNNVVAVGCAGVQQTLCAPGTGYYIQQYCSLTRVVQE